MFPHSLAAGPLPHCQGGTLAPGLPGSRTWDQGTALSTPHPHPISLQAFGDIRNWDSVGCAGLEAPVLGLNPAFAS